MKNMFIALLVFVSMAAFAESQTETTAAQAETAAQATEASVAAPTEGSIIGGIDIRPSLFGQTGMMRTENAVDLGYKFNPDMSVLYEQDFNTNLYSPDDTMSGLQPELREGFFKGKFNNLWNSPGKDWSVGYEARVYLPTRTTSRDAGMITALRNYFKLGYQASDSVKLTLMEIPIFHVYSQSGFAGAANPGIENRVYLIADWQISEKLALSFPLMLNSTKYRTFNAPNGNQLSHFVWINPELIYAVGSNYGVGLAYYNNTGLMSEDLSQFTFSEAFEDSVFQLVFQASL